MTEDLPPDASRIDISHPSQVRPVGRTLMNLGKRRDPRALLALLRVQLRKEPHTPELLLTAADTALMAEEWSEAVTYAKELVLVAGDLRGMAILVDALFQLGRKADLDALCAHLGSSLHEGLQGTDIRSGDEESPVDRIRMRLAQHLMKRGDLVEGMAIRSGLRFMKRGIIHPLAQRREIPWWATGDADCPLLVISEQGLGEQILWAAAFDELSASHPGSVVECTGKLLPVFQRSFPSARIVSYESDELTRIEGTEYRKIMASELDHALGMRTRIDCPEPWLKPDADKVLELRSKYQNMFPGKRLVGLSWKSHHPHYGKYKSIPLEDFGSLLRTPGCVFMSLQYGDISLDLQAAASAGAPVPLVDNAIDAMNDFDTWLAQVAAMDVVVTTSNTTAHASAALGKHTILILPSPVNVFYYWGYRGASTPWYPPTLQIVRAIDDPIAAVNAARDILLHAP